MILTAKIVLREKKGYVHSWTMHYVPLCCAKTSRTWSQQSLLRGRCDRSQLRWKRESHVLTYQIQIALVREAERSKMFAHVLDQDLRRRCAGRQAHATYAFQPFRVNILGIVN